MDPPSLDNRTGYAVLPQLLMDRDGEKLAVLVKATYELPVGATSLEVAPPPRRRGIRLADVPWAELEKSSILYPADLCLRKPGTDVVVVAKAYAPDGRAVPSFDAGVRVGPVAKALRIFGLRVWQKGGGGLSAPRPVAEQELRYDHAWGGYDDSDPDHPVEEPRNPVGTGFVRDPDALTHTPAPSIEDPAEPITSWRTRPAPAGVGAIARHWEPRRRYLGTYDAAWLESRAPLLPADADDRGNLCATPDLVAATPLLGAEEVVLSNLVPGGGATRFALPGVGVEIDVRVKGREPEVVRPYLDTVLVDTLVVPRRPPTVELVWRAHVKAPRRMKDARILVREREIR
jgi:hypothetical protein